MLELFKIFGTIDLKGQDKAEQGLDNVDKKAKGVGGKFGSMAKTVGKAGAVVGGAMAAAGTAAFAMSTKITGAFDDISKGAQRVGVSTDFYQEMDYWASQNGLSHERMEKAVGRFNQRLGQATNGNERYSGALESLGVNLDDVRNGTVSTEDAFAQSIQTLSEMESQQDQVNLATELFGTRMARDMLPALQDGALSIDDARAKAQELGIVIGEDSLDAGVKFQDSWDSIKRSMGAVGMQIGSQLLPVFQKIMDWVLDNMPMIQSIIQTAFDAIGVVFNTANSWIQKLIAMLGEWFSSNEETMSGIWETIQTYFGFILDYWISVWETIQKFWQENGQSLLEYAQLYFGNIRDTVQMVFEAVWDIIKQIIGWIVPFVQEQLGRIQKFWEENGDQIMKAVDNAFSFIQGVIEFVMPIIQGIIKGAWEIISAIFDTAVGIIMGIVKTLASLLTGDFEGIKEGLTSIWESMWDGIRGVVAGAWTLLSGAFSGLWESVSGWFTGLADDALSWGKDLIRGFISGITGMAGTLKRKISTFIENNVPGPVQKVLGIASPSKLFKDFGQDTGEGYVIGMEDKKRDVERASIDMARSAINPFDAGSVAGNMPTNKTTNNRTENKSQVDNRTINITVDASNIQEVQQMIELFTGLKQSYNAY